MTSNSSPKWLIDLSKASDDGLALVLLRVSGTDLLKSCAQVSRKWNRILTQKSFWIAKAELDGYKLEWPRLSALPDGGHAQAIRQKLHQGSFGLGKSGRKLAERQAMDNECNRVCIEAPPVFMDGQPKANAEIGEPPDACLATSSYEFGRVMTIKLADEGLSDEIIDELRPTLVVTELVANRRDCASQYSMKCRLSDSSHRDRERMNQTVEEKKEFAQWEAEGWHRVECVFKNYPAGMRYLKIHCFGQVSQGSAGNYGLKVARCRVEAICESNRNNIG